MAAEHDEVQIIGQGLTTESVRKQEQPDTGRHFETPYMNLAEVARYIRRSKNTVRSYRRRGLFVSACMVGRTPIFHKDDVDVWMLRLKEDVDSGEHTGLHWKEPVFHKRENS